MDRRKSRNTALIGELQLDLGNGLENVSRTIKLGDLSIDNSLQLSCQYEKVMSFYLPICKVLLRRLSDRQNEPSLKSDRNSKLK